MAKRVSMRGRGAALFFGEEAGVGGPLPEVAALAPASAAEQAAPPETAEQLDVPAAPSAPPASMEAAAVPFAEQPAAAPESAAIERGEAPARRPARGREARGTGALASYPDELIAAIRKVVKVPGREVSFVRLSPGEKAQLADIVYTYKRQGQRTSENEINRIALNFLLEDFQLNGEQSVLARTLAALLA